MPYGAFDPPRFGNGIHWRALAILLMPPAAGLTIRVMSGPLGWWAVLALLIAVPCAAAAAWKFSSYVNDTHSQPWGYISFFAMLGSFWTGWLCLAGWWM